MNNNTVMRAESDVCHTLQVTIAAAYKMKIEIGTTMFVFEIDSSFGDENNLDG
jgi:hypothetical protein